MEKSLTPLERFTAVVEKNQQVQNLLENMDEPRKARLIKSVFTRLATKKSVKEESARSISPARSGRRKTWRWIGFITCWIGLQFINGWFSIGSNLLVLSTFWLIPAFFYRKYFLATSIILLAILVLTNPGPSSFANFAHRYDDKKHTTYRRVANHFVYSMYVKEYPEHDEDDEIGGDIQQESYIGFLGNFY